MNIKEYISSGIIESCMLGLASPEEQAEFERMCIQHPEVRVARENFELSLESFALNHQTAPPAHIRQQLFSTLAVGATDQSVEAPVVPARGVVMTARWPRYVAAASIVLLIGSLVANLYFYNQYRAYSTRYDALLAQQSQLAKNNDAMQTRLQEYGEMMHMLKDTAMSMVKMMGSSVPSSPAPSAMATVLWNTRSSDVYVMVNNLPASAADKQYELWAIVDGKPVAAGVFDVTSNSPMVKLNNVTRAQAFAVTLERRGGVAVPEGPMYVLGKI